VVGGIVVVARAGVVVVVDAGDGFCFATALNQAAACAGDPSCLFFAHATSPGTRTVTSSTPTTRRTIPKLATPSNFRPAAPVPVMGAVRRTEGQQSGLPRTGGAFIGAFWGRPRRRSGLRTVSAPTLNPESEGRSRSVPDAGRVPSVTSDHEPHEEATDGRRLGR
jgi:hypothetical protein